MHKSRIQQYQIITNQLIAHDVYKMTLKGDNTWVTKPGQFMNIEIENAYLKRPISICEVIADGLVIIYKVVGFGTKQLACKQIGDNITALVGLGNGFTINDNQAVLIVGGGVGVPPLYGLSQALVKQGIKIKVVLGFNAKVDVFYEDEFRELSTNVIIATNDGTYGEKGYVSDVIKQAHWDQLYYYACGPEPMLKAVAQLSKAEGQLSFEARMGCGFGACMGCSCETITGYKRICVDGPIMLSKELIWKD